MWRYLYNDTTQDITFNAMVSADKLLVGDEQSTSTIIHLDFSTYESGTGNFKSNVYNLPSNSIVKKIEVLLDDKMGAGDNISFKGYYSDNPTGSATIGTMEHDNDGAVAEKTFRSIDKETASVQIAWDWSSGTKGVKQVKIYYDRIEKPV